METLVTGSAMGIGLACAEAFAKAGYITVLADIKEPAEQATKLAAEGCKAVAYRCDVSDTQEVRKMIRLDCFCLRTIGCGLEQCRHPDTATSDGGDYRR